jgi:ABC-type sugar transport system ATPase subunit
MTTPVLEARGIVKRFGALTALGGVSFDLRAGEVHALCGENGAGKSTLIKLLAGVHPHGSYEGEILIDGRLAVFGSTRDAERAGIAIIHQELALFPEMSVGENLFLGALPRRRGRIDCTRSGDAGGGPRRRSPAAGRDRAGGRAQAARARARRADRGAGAARNRHLARAGAAAA